MTRCQTYVRQQYKTIYISVFLITMSLIFSMTSYAFSLEGVNTTWHPIISIGVGASISSQVGESKTFPIQDPVTDAFYDYANYKVTQSSSLLDGFLGAECHVSPQWALQIGADYNQAASFTARGTLTQGADIQSEDTYHYRYRIMTKQLLLEGKLLYTTHKKYHPYLLLGVGAAFNRAYNYDTNVPPFIAFTRLYQNKSTSSFSYAIGVGIDVDITSHMRVGAGYRFVDLGKVKLGSATIDTTPVNGTLTQDHLYTNEVLAQITFIA